MNTRVIPLAMLCVLWGVTATLFAESPLQNPSEAATAANAIGYLKTAGEAWKDQQGCVSCHQIPAMLWSLSAAESHGLAVSADELNGWKNWSTTVANFVKPSQQTDLNVDETLAGNIDTMAALMLAIPDQVRTSDDAPWREQFANKLCAEQAEDGSWKACGQLPAQRRPKQETAQATTLWVTLALLRHHTDEFDLDSAIQFADAGPEAQSTEWYAARLLVAAESEQASAETFRTKLLSLQHEDGGWGWIADESSDALATGMSLYALGQTGPSSSPEITKAREFLRGSQLESGRWDVPGTKTSAKGNSTPTSTYWGTAWAVVGLLSTR